MYTGVPNSQRSQTVDCLAVCTGVPSSQRLHTVVLSTGSAVYTGVPSSQREQHTNGRAGVPQGGCGQVRPVADVPDLSTSYALRTVLHCRVHLF